LLIALILGLAGLVAVTLWLGEPGQWRHLFRLGGSTLTWAMVLLVASFLGGGLRLVAILRMAGARTDFLRATRAHILGLFAAAVTPSGGGNGLAIGFALQRDGIKPNVAWSAAVYGSVLDLFYFAWTLPIAGFLLYRTQLISQNLLWFTLAVSAFSLALWYGLAFHLGRVRHLIRPLLGWRILKRWRKRTLRFLDDVSSAMNTISRGSFLSQVGLNMLTLPVHLSAYAILHLFAVALGSPLSLMQTLSLMVLISAASQVVPTPGGSGYFEVALSYAFSQGGAHAQMTAAVIAFRALTYYVPIVVGALLGGSVLISELNRANAQNAAQPELETEQEAQQA